MNFALPDWIEQGRTAVEAYRFKRSSVFPHAEFVISAALDLIKEVEESDDTASEDEDGSEKKTEQIAPYDLADFRPRIKFELERLLNKEREDRQRLQKVGLTRIVPLTTKQLKEECKQCDVCGFDCYVSGVVCDCNNAISFCLSHAEGVSRTTNQNYRTLSHIFLDSVAPAKCLVKRSNTASNSSFWKRRLNT